MRAYTVHTSLTLEGCLVVMMLVVRSERGFIFSTMLTLTAYIRLHLVVCFGVSPEGASRVGLKLAHGAGVVLLF